MEKNVRKRTLLSKLARRLLAIPHRRSHRKEQARIKKAEQKTRFLEAERIRLSLVRVPNLEKMKCPAGGR